MFNLLKSFFHSEDGNFAIIFGLTLLPIAFITGITVDYSEIERHRSRLQETADAAALFAVKELEKAGFGKTQAESVAEDMKDSNFDIQGLVDLQLDTDTRKITVRLTKQYQPAFVSLFRPEPIDIGVLSEVTYDFTKGNAKCMVSLSETGKGVLSLNGNAVVDASTCNVHVNSSSDDSVDLDGNGTKIVASENCFVGGVADGADRIYPPPNEKCEVIPNPFADEIEVATYSDDDCQWTDYTASGNRSVELYPGVYCGGIDIGSQINAKFHSGLYVIKDGRFKTTGNAVLYGDGVTFLFTGTDIGLNFSGGTEFYFKAMTKGDYAGFIVFFDPDADLSGTSSFSGGPNTYFEGVLYFSEHNVEINGDAEVNADSPLSVLIADTITLNGNATLHFNVNEDNSYIDLPDILYDKEIVAYLSK